MKKLSFVLSFALLLPASVAFAETSLPVQTNVKVNTDVEVGSQSGDVQSGDRVEASSSMNVRGDARASATGTAAREDNENASTTAGGNGERMSEAHRSVVATFVKSLLADANRDGGIGEEVRAVAQSQNDSASTTADAIVKVENRSKVMSFLFGTDWKNLGAIRSEIAKGNGDMQRLESALNKTTDASVRADLTTQIATLKAEQDKVQAFVDAHANSFSLFGWFTKLFVSTSTDTGK
jgi:hypothetical protein